MKIQNPIAVSTHIFYLRLSYPQFTQCPALASQFSLAKIYNFNKTRNLMAAPTEYGEHPKTPQTW